MTLYKQFESAIKGIENITVQTGSNFFMTEVIPKLHTLCDLMELNAINHSGLQAYLDLYRNDIQLDIEKCLAISPGTSEEEKEALLDVIKKHVRPKIKVLEYAFCYYLKDDALLHADRSNNRAEKLPSKRPQTNELVPGTLNK